MWGRIMGLLKKFRTKTDGNVAMMFGVVSTLLMLSAGMAIDGSRLLSLRSDLQNITDTAALAGAHAADIEQDRRWGAVKETIDFHLNALGNDVELVDFDINFDDATESLAVQIDVRQDLLFSGFLGRDFGKASSNSMTSYALDNVRPVSISMVLDVSGSMNEITGRGLSRLDVVKGASIELFDAIKDGAPRPAKAREQVRTSLNVYNTELLPNFTVPFVQGWGPVVSRIQELVAGGGTNSTDAFEAGYSALKYDTEQPGGLQQFIIFMTDGNNNQSSSDTDTLALCDRAKSEGMRVFTVAFEAPANGQALLEACASEPPENHYFDASNAAQFRAAFDQIGATIASLNTRITN